MRECSSPWALPRCFLAESSACSERVTARGSGVGDVRSIEESDCRRASLRGLPKLAGGAFGQCPREINYLYTVVVADEKLPAASQAVTLIVCEPEDAFFVFQLHVYGEAVSVHRSVSSM